MNTEPTTALIALQDDELDCVAGGHDWHGFHFPDININLAVNVNVDVNTQTNIINFIGNVIDANGPVQIALGQQSANAH
jgi:hypothetical protein